MNILKINGQALEGIYVDAAISFNKPAKRVSTYSVPGRNGDLVIDEGTFDNVLITYPVFEKNTFPAEFDAIVNYLASLEGYQRIECSNDPQHYRLGRFVVPQNPTAKRLNRDGYWQLSFDCKPQRWLLSGEEDTEIDANPIDEYSGDIVSIDAVALDEITELKANIVPVQSGSGDPSPSNIRPISGHTEVNVYNDPKYGGTIEWNQRVQTLRGTGEENGITYTNNGDGSLTLNGTSNNTTAKHPGLVANTFEWLTTHKYLVSLGATPPSKFYIRLNSATTIVFADGTGGISSSAGIGIPSADITAGLVQRIAANAGLTYSNYTIKPNVFDLTQMFGATKADEIYAMEQAQAGSGVAYFKSLFPKDYYPYNAGEETCVSAVNGDPYGHYPISLGQTVYGGTLNVTTGVLTVDRVTETFTSFTGQVETNGFRTGQTVSLLPKSSYPELTCNMFGRAEGYSYATGALGNGNVIGLNGSGLILLCAKDNDGWVTNLNDLNALIPQEGCQICYEIATPLTVQLTAAEVTTLLGQNNIWADTGDVEVKVTSPTNFINPSLFNSKPLIRVYGIGTFRVNDITVTIASHDKPYIDIDCELQECFYEGENMNEYVSFSGNDFPELEPGNNYMLLASGITKLIVTPRWWIL